MSEALVFRGELKGHSGWVTCIATTDQNASFLLSGSRDKSLIIWEIFDRADEYGLPKKSLRGHNHFVSDVTLSSDGQFALSGSWDSTLRLWDLASGEATRRFIGHEKDVLSVAFSTDNRHIVSASRDKTLRLWNTLGECKYVLKEDGHSDWVSCVRFPPATEDPVIVSAGWDKVVKVWRLSNCKLKANLLGHTGYLTTVTVSPDGSLCASGGKDKTAILWDLNDCKRLYSLDAGSTIHALTFSPNRYWLVAATDKAVKVWDLESKAVVAELTPEFTERAHLTKDALVPYCTSLAWSADGATLYGGYTDNIIRVWKVMA